LEKEDLMPMTMTSAKTETLAAVSVAVIGAAGITLHDALELWQLGASALLATAGSGYAISRWWRDIRGGKNKDRRHNDKKRENDVI